MTIICLIILFITWSFSFLISIRISKVPGNYINCKIQYSTVRTALLLVVLFRTNFMSNISSEHLSIKKTLDQMLNQHFFWCIGCILNEHFSWIANSMQVLIKRFTPVNARSKKIEENKQESYMYYVFAKQEENVTCSINCQLI